MLAPCEQRGRGWVRGFLFVTAAVVLIGGVGCEDKPKPAPDPSDAGTKAAKEMGAAVGATDAAAKADVAVDMAPPPPVEFAPPWTTLAPPVKSLKNELAQKEIGKISGEAWGSDRVLRGIVRSHCGSGALLQAVFEGDKGLQITPAMPVRFVGLATKKPVTYNEGGFDVTVDFDEDSDQRLTGSLKITYEEQGQEKTFIDLTVDGTPMPMLLEPQLDGEGRLPEFQSCHPSGRFYAKAADGREARGFVFAARSQNQKGIVTTPLLSPQTGLRVVAYAEESLDEPWTIDLSKDVKGAPIRVAITAFYTPVLTTPETARGPNIGSEQKVTVRRGTVEVDWTKKGKNPVVKMRFTDLQIPELIEGPLRGTTFEEFVLEVEGTPQGVYPAPPEAEPLGPSTQE